MTQPPAASSLKGQHLQHHGVTKHIFLPKHQSNGTYINTNSSHVSAHAHTHTHTRLVPKYRCYEQGMNLPNPALGLLIEFSWFTARFPRRAVCGQCVEAHVRVHAPLRLRRGEASAMPGARRWASALLPLFFPFPFSSNYRRGVRLPRVRHPSRS